MNPKGSWNSKTPGMRELRAAVGDILKILTHVGSGKTAYAEAEDVFVRRPFSHFDGVFPTFGNDAADHIFVEEAWALLCEPFESSVRRRIRYARFSSRKTQFVPVASPCKRPTRTEEVNVREAAKKKILRCSRRSRLG